MLNSDWKFIIAFGLVFADQALAQQLPEQTIDQQDESGGQQQGQNSATPPGLPVRILEVPEQSEDAKRDQREAEQREIDDLVAQQMAAKAAEHSYQIGIAQTILAFFGTLALIYSLYLNRRATDAAVVASKAAMDALNSERAWMLPDGYACEPWTDIKIDGVQYSHALGFSMIWKNSGRSPAVHLSAYFDSKIIDLDDDIPAFFAPPYSGVKPGFVAPGGSTRTISHVIAGDELARLERGEVKLVVYSCTEYGTVASPDIPCRTEACFAIHINGEVNDASGRKAPNINMQPVGIQNTAN